VGRWQERFGPRKMIALGVILTALASLVVSQVTSIYTVYAWAGLNGLAYFALPVAGGIASSALLAAVIGFSFGTLFSVSAPLVADCFGLEHFGAIFGLTFAAYGFVAGPLGPTLSGYLLDVTGDNFRLVFVYLGIFCLLAGLCIRRVVPPRKA
jgi:OFA family oxalate/formate antiporter-like MFS transporter